MKFIDVIDRVWLPVLLVAIVILTLTGHAGTCYMTITTTTRP